GRRIGDPDRVDALDLREALEQRDRASVERGREAREHAGVAELRPEPEPSRTELCDQLLLRRLSRILPASLVRLGRQPACGGAGGARPPRPPPPPPPPPPRAPPPPGAAPRSASGGVRSTTIIRCPTGTSGR